MAIGAIGIELVRARVECDDDRVEKP